MQKINTQQLDVKLYLQVICYANVKDIYLDKVKKIKTSFDVAV